ncbi:MAG TPA: transglycosylase SLT domain-containing protein [Dermatophilaceae bacterium]|nr:transglycosylase SLT domain-containing protein [Dermatophilaceae bacterium]
MVLTQLRPLAALAGVVAVVLAGQAAAAPAKPAAPPGTYVVTKGETLSSVAKAVGVTVSDLAAANGIVDVHRIQAGARLVVPGAPPAKVDPATLPVMLPDGLKARPDRLALIPSFDAAAKEFGVPANLVKAMTWQESGWQNEKVSSTKAVGIGQLMPDTVVFVNDVLLRARLDPKRPDHNIRMSARFLAYLLRQSKGDVTLALSSYYQGLASVRRAGPLPETKRYVANVLALQNRF